MDTENISRNELLEILLTCDGKGKEEKKRALDLLEARAYGQGVIDERGTGE